MSSADAAGLSSEALAALADLAVQAVQHAVGCAPRPLLAAPRRAAGASFVTLRQGLRLRGCIGSLEAHRALDEDVCANAMAAATSDPRFAALVVHELHLVTLEVAVLSTPEALPFASAQELYATLRPRVDGLILEYGGRRATYLPSVWTQLPEPEQFVNELRRKAGIAPDCALTTLTCLRYTAQHSMLTACALRT